MNILVFAHDSYLYGASQSLLTVLKGIRKKKDRNILVLLPFPGIMEEKLRSMEIDFKIIPFPRCVAFDKESGSTIQRLQNIVGYYKKMFCILPKLKKIAGQFKPDVIYTNTSVVAAGYKIAKHFRIAHVWHIREFGNLDFNFKYYPGRKKIAHYITKSEKSIFASFAIKKHWVTKDSCRQSVIYNGILGEVLDSDKLFKEFPKENVKIGLLGAILPGKGQHIAISAFEKLIKTHTKCELMFYGDPADRNYFNSLQKLVLDLKIEDRVFFKPFIDDKKYIYGNLDIVLNCSKMEGFGRTIVEAMGYGIPVIAKASGGVLEIIDDKINGMLFDDSNESLSNALTELLSDKNLYENLSINGTIKAQKYSIENYVNSVDAILYDAYMDTFKY